MPIYVYKCKACGGEFEELIMSSSAEQNVACTSCQSKDVQRQMSVFATTSSDSACTGSSCATGTCPFAN